MFITNTACSRPVTDQIADALEGGCKWIQIRMKDATDEEIKKVVDDVKPMCEKHEAVLLLDDRVELCRELTLSGVHLGKTDMLPGKARVLLGPSAIIGCTANTFDDVLAVRSLDVDYIGIGPYAYTETKSNLAPVLGLDGVAGICAEMDKNDISLARVAVGGITLQDVDRLMQAGCNGIAVSGAIANAEDAVETTRAFIKALSKYEKEEDASVI